MGEYLSDVRRAVFLKQRERTKAEYGLQHAVYVAPGGAARPANIHTDVYMR